MDAGSRETAAGGPLADHLAVGVQDQHAPGRLPDGRHDVLDPEEPDPALVAQAAQDGPWRPSPRPV